MSTAVQTQVQGQAAATGQQIVVKTAQGEIKLDPMTVRRYLVRGNGAVTDQEVMFFMALCKYQELNPFLRDAYLIKYGNQDASIVVGKDAYAKRAEQHPGNMGYTAGVICARESGELLYTKGIIPPGTKLIGGWAEVKRRDRDEPIAIEVPFNEYVARKQDGSPNKQWTEKPATMIRKVALVQAWREAFPQVYAGMYSEEEIQHQEDLPRAPVNIDSMGRTEQQSPTSFPMGNGDASAPEAEGTNKAGEFGRRSRRNSIELDGKEVKTCGITAEQVELVRAFSRVSPDARTFVQKWMTQRTGYNDLSYLRDDEAGELIEEIKTQDPPVSSAPQAEEMVPFGDLAEPTVKQNPEGGEKAVGSSEDMPADLVFCPILGDKMSVSLHCHAGKCRDRERQGFCPIVDGIEQDNGLI